MDTFRTTFPAFSSAVKISHDHPLLFIGSCFTEHIGRRLSDRKFQVLVNPFGIVYNPVSIAGCLQRLWDGNRPFSSDELFERDGLWHSRQHHGAFSKPSPEQTLAGINEAYARAAERLRNCRRLLVTLGAAEVHYLADDDSPVANNHKMPAALFRQRRLSVGETTDALLEALEPICTQLPDLHIILNVSPVRHLRNGMIDNQRSKAVLLLACEAVCKALPRAHYFPSYELLLDDLRDYRFYAADMIHPSEQAVEYIWHYFSEAYFSEDTRRLNVELEKLLQAAQHRPLHPESEQYQKFAAAHQANLQRLKEQFPQLAWDEGK